MASVHKLPHSPNWIAFLRDGEGRQRVRSTGLRATRENKVSAMRWAEAAEGALRSGDVDRLRAVTESIAAEIGRPRIGLEEARQGWLGMMRPAVRAESLRLYERSTRQFCDWLLQGPGKGSRGGAGRTMESVTAGEVGGFVAAELGRGVRGITVRTTLQHLRAWWARGVVAGWCRKNVASEVPMPREAEDGQGRTAFTREQLAQLLGWLRGAEGGEENGKMENGEMVRTGGSDVRQHRRRGPEGEWRRNAAGWALLIRLGLYTGQRVGDLTRAGAGDFVDTAGGGLELRIRTRKTGRQQFVPVHGSILPAMRARMASVPEGPLFGFFTREKFARLLRDAGIDRGTNHTGLIAVSRLSFHSLRHTLTSWLKEAGVASSVVQDLIGHESAAVSARYTHTSDAARREAVEGMPVV